MLNTTSSQENPPKLQAIKTKASNIHLKSVKYGGRSQLVWKPIPAHSNTYFLTPNSNHIPPNIQDQEKDSYSEGGWYDPPVNLTTSALAKHSKEFRFDSPTEERRK